MAADRSTAELERYGAAAAAGWTGDVDLRDALGRLPEGMERFTADLRPPAGLTCQIARRRRRRRLALCSLTGAVAALGAGAVALAVAVAPSPPHAGIDLTADVVKHVNSALTAADPGNIAQMTVTTSSAGTYGGKTAATTAEEWSYGDQRRSVTYSSPGHPPVRAGPPGRAPAPARIRQDRSARLRDGGRGCPAVVPVRAAGHGLAR